MAFKFEQLEVWQQSLKYIDLIYTIAADLPDDERFNMCSQITRAATSINLNIAEGSTGQTDAEQARFLGLALRSLIETVACQHIIHRRGWLTDTTLLRQAYRQAGILAARLQTMRKTIAPGQNWIREDIVDYTTDVEDDPW
ncbi:MAG: four helix bundle protein, partial [Roseiflexaceae bacterium]